MAVHSYDVATRLLEALGLGGQEVVKLVIVVPPDDVIRVVAVMNMKRESLDEVVNVLRQSRDVVTEVAGVDVMVTDAEPEIVVTEVH